MIKNTLRIGLLLAVAAPACMMDDTTTANRAIIDTPCETDPDCPAGFECEVEVEHGTTISFCQADEDSDGTCPPGYEQEFEHGQLYCKPHGGDSGGADDDDDVDGGSDSADDSDGGGSSDICMTDADCAPGLECEVEIEHGEMASTCKPHGGV